MQLEKLKLRTCMQACVISKSRPKGKKRGGVWGRSHLLILDGEAYMGLLLLYNRISAVSTTTITAAARTNVLLENDVSVSPMRTVPSSRILSSRSISPSTSVASALIVYVPTDVSDVSHVKVNVVLAPELSSVTC